MLRRIRVLARLAVVLSCLWITAGTAFAPDAMQAEAEAGKALRVLVFYSPSCHECHVVTEEVLPALQRDYGPLIVIEQRSIDEIATYRELLEYEKHYGSEENEPLKMFIGERYLVGARAISAEARRIVEEELANGSRTFSPKDAATGRSVEKIQPAGKEVLPKSVIERFRSFSPLAVAGAGLVDGVNPCAFTTIVFLLSVLTLLGKTRKHVLSVGAAFTLGVFCAYLLLGLGVFKAVKAFAVSHQLSLCITYAAASLAFVLAGLSMFDYLRYRSSKDARSISLKLPHWTRARINKIIREKLTTSNLVTGSFTLGLLVSVLEAMCTGQVYLPTIVFVQGDEALRAHALMYLVLYNVMFIVPLIGIFLSAYFGVRSEHLGKFLRQHIGAFKLALAAIFLLLGAALIASV